MADGLTTKQQAFIAVYLANGFNATDAARQAGYSEKTARSIGAENLTKPDIQAVIQARLAALAMPAAEVLARLAMMARGSIADFIDLPEPGPVDQEAKPVASGWRLNLAKAEQRGQLPLIKKIESGQWGPKIELYDAQAALQLLGKQHSLFVERTEVTGANGAPLFPDFERALEMTYADDGDPPTE